MHKYCFKGIPFQLSLTFFSMRRPKSTRDFSKTEKMALAKVIWGCQLLPFILFGGVNYSRSWKMGFGITLKHQTY